MKIIVSLETKESIDIAHRVVDYVDGFKINHMLWDEIIAWPEDWAKYRKKELFVDFKLWDTPNTVETVVKKVIDRGGTMVSINAHNCQETFERLKKLSDQINIQNIEIEDKSFLHKNHKGNQEGKYHLKLNIVSDELKNMNRIESNKKIYKVLDKELKETIHSIQIQLS